MILLTGATGTVGHGPAAAAARRGATRCARSCAIRGGSGPQRVDVQIALGDLARSATAPRARRCAACDTVIHLAAAIRDQPPRPHRGAQRARRRCGCCGPPSVPASSASSSSRRSARPRFQRTRFFRAKALAEQAVVERRALETTVFAPSIVYDRDDPWVTLLRRLSLLPVLPVSGDGPRAYQPIWARRRGALRRSAALGARDGAQPLRARRPRACSATTRSRGPSPRAAGRAAAALHVPLPLVRTGLIWLRRLVGESAFATWEEAELMEVAMTTQRGTADAEALGVKPLAMREVLGAASCCPGARRPSSRRSQAWGRRCRRRRSPAPACCGGRA